MRILFLSHYYPPEGNAPATRVAAMCKRWVAMGHEVDVITCAPNVPDGVVYSGYRNRLLQREEMDGVTVSRVWTFIAANRGSVRRSLNYFSFLVTSILRGLFVTKPDVVVATSPQFFNGVAGWWLSRLRRVPFCLEIRDIWPESVATVGAVSHNLPLRILEFLELRMYRSARRIVTVGSGYREKLKERGVEADRIDVVENGADLEEFSFDAADPESVREEFDLGSRFVCAYVGTLGMAHGLEVSIRAAVELERQWPGRFVILIVGSGARSAALRSLSEELGASNVVFAGLQPKNPIPSFIAACDVCLVHLTKTDLFKTVLPSKIFEGAAMGKPIVLGVDGSARNLVENHEIGVYFEPENPQELIECLIDLYNDAERRDYLGGRGIEVVRSRYSRDGMARKYIDILSRVSGERMGAANEVT